MQNDKELYLCLQQGLIWVKTFQSDNVNLSLFSLLHAQRQKQTQAGNQEQPSQGQVGWGFEHPSPVECDPAHGRDVE